jgi:hypothetical protein
LNLFSLFFVRKSPNKFNVGVGILHVDPADQGELTPDDGVSDLIGVLDVRGRKVLRDGSVRQECD